jgi:hypothetical protein
MQSIIKIFLVFVIVMAFFYVKVIFNIKDVGNILKYPITMSVSKVLIIIPYRDRSLHLESFKKKVGEILADIPHDILVVEQANEKPFNRAWLTNIGIMYSSPKYTCIIQHDVDRYPLTYVNYTDCETPIQLNSENKQWGGGLPYAEYTGGVVSMSRRHWIQINGMSNIYNGYGGEDDDLFFRLRSNNLLNGSHIRRPKHGAGKFGEWHSDDTHNKRSHDPVYRKVMRTRLDLMKGGSDIWKRDGLNNVKFYLKDTETNGNAEHIYVDFKDTTRLPTPLPTRIPKSIIYSALGGDSYISSRKYVEDLVYSIHRSVDDPTIKLFVNGDVSNDLNFFAHSMRVEIVYCTLLVPPYTTTRFYCYNRELYNEGDQDRVAFVDSGDVTFERDIFKLIKAPLHLVQEPHTFPMSKCPHHKKWISGCKEYGPAVWNSIKDNDLVCAGTIFGTVGGLKPFMTIFTNEMIKTKCNDQGILNVLVYTGRIKPHLWAYKDNVVLSMNVAKKYEHKGSYVVHTGDNPTAVTTMKNRGENVFRDVLSFEDQVGAYSLLRDIDRAVNSTDYVIDGGTLIGAHLNGKRIPWDDDMDIYILEKDLDVFFDSVKKNNMGVAKSYNGLYYKIWDLGTKPHVNNHQKYNWPFVDVGILVGNKTHLWEKRVSESKYSHHIYKREWVFPSKSILYEGFKLRGPSDPDAFLNWRFGKGWENKCTFVNWDHRLEKTRYPFLGDGNVKTITPCHTLKWI